MRIVTVTCLFLSLVAPAFAGKVWVVGPGAGQLHDLQDTIILAQEGDVVLVKQGTHESIRAVGRTVTLVAENGATVQLQGGVRVVDYPSPRTIVLSGVRVHASTSGPAETMYGLFVRNCAGQIVVQDCTLTNSTHHDYGTGVVDMRNSTGSLSAVRSVLTGDASNAFTQTCGIAIGSGAHVALADVTAQGANGKNALPPPTHNDIDSNGCAGSPGMYVNALPNNPAIVFAANSMFIGGSGGFASWGAHVCLWCGHGGSGGDGIFGVNPNNPLMLLGVSAFGGAGGAAALTCQGSCGLPLPGPPGDPIYAGHTIQNIGCLENNSQYPPTPYAIVAGSARRLSGSRLIRDNAIPSFTFQGNPGEIVELAASLRTTFIPSLSQGGVIQVAGNAWHRLGTVTGSGSLVRSIKLTDLPVTDPGATYFMQARFRDPATSQVRLSNLHVLVQVDATY